MRQIHQSPAPERGTEADPGPGALGARLIELANLAVAVHLALSGLDQAGRAGRPAPRLAEAGANARAPSRPEVRA
ncbi:MAG TPA: hypothetical protein VD963_09085 [Phycisphaerales bacterium]|nr:hypothetical protein [Phycisphaerales bacterium]